MEEVKRRIYRHPFLLVAVALAAGALLAVSFVSARGRASGVFIPAGDDRFETTDNGETYHNFAGSPIPAGFFNTDGLSTSQPYGGLVPVKGVPLPNQGNVDTIIHRDQSVTTPGSTTIQITGFSLKSINPIIVSYSDRPSEQWDMRVGLSQYTPSTGTMTITDDGSGGGTFNSSLSIYPRFTFVRVRDGAVKVLDTGSQQVQAAIAEQSAAAAGDSPSANAAIATCKATATDTTAASSDDSVSSMAATTGCAPVNMSSTNSPWSSCGGRFCIPRPITEDDAWARHNASPPGTIPVATTTTATAGR